MSNDTTDPIGRPVTLPEGVDGDALREAHVGVMTACGPMCDRKHLVDEPHNRNLAPDTEDHRQPKATARADADPDLAITFPWDGEEWTYRMADANSMEFLAALEDADSGEDPGGMVRAMRLMLGKDQATRLFKGRSVDAMADFFTAAGEAGGMGNR